MPRISLGARRRPWELQRSRRSSPWRLEMKGTVLLPRRSTRTRSHTSSRGQFPTLIPLNPSAMRRPIWAQPINFAKGWRRGRPVLLVSLRFRFRCRLSCTMRSWNRKLSTGLSALTRSGIFLLRLGISLPKRSGMLWSARHSSQHQLTGSPYTCRQRSGWTIVLDCSSPSSPPPDGLASRLTTGKISWRCHLTQTLSSPASSL